MTTVAAIIIGDEILSGKVADTNTGTLIAALRDRGVTLARVSVIGDDLEQIGDEVCRSSGSCDWVITSGGLGPTHDDRTIAGIARAFDRPIVRPASLERAVRAHFGEHLNASALRLAEVPEGTELLDAGAFPLLRCENTYILPGVPQIFEAKLQRICATLTGRPPALRRLYLQARESAIAECLQAAEGAAPAVKIGSYPRLDAPDHNLMVTVEAPEPEAADAALAYLLGRLGAGLVVRVA